MGERATISTVSLANLTKIGMELDVARIVKIRQLQNYQRDFLICENHARLKRPAWLVVGHDELHSVAPQGKLAAKKELGIVCQMATREKIRAKGKSCLKIYTSAQSWPKQTKDCELICAPTGK